MRKPEKRKRKKLAIIKRGTKRNNRAKASKKTKWLRHEIKRKRVVSDQKKWEKQMQGLTGKPQD